ncbi:MAG: HAD-IIA family hydrolase [Acidimicrobiia bacterium]|nr:HAD-IIA family hydrolase [Acidimicrobiia bacterium]
MSVPAGGSRGNLVCDLDGVVYLTQTAVPGAGAALQALEERGYRIIFATNAPIRLPAEVAAHIAAVGGYRARPEQVVTSAMAAASVLSSADAPVLVVGEGGLGPTLEAAGLALSPDPDEARSVVVGLDRQLTYDHLRRATRAVLGGARLIACNADPTYPTESGLWPGGGAIVAAVEAASGRRAEVVGKPYPAMTALVRRALGPGPTWVVGDRPETDLALGCDENWTTVLVLTGVIRDPAEVPQHLRADIVVPSLAHLPDRLP